jgi:hypothetical protein
MGLDVESTLDSSSARDIVGAMEELKSRGDDLFKDPAWLRGYYEGQAPYLEPRTREICRSFISALASAHQGLWGSTAYVAGEASAIQELRQHGLQIAELPENSLDYLREAVEHARQELSGDGPANVPAQDERFENERERVTGTRPWWRRVFGG